MSYRRLSIFPAIAVICVSFFLGFKYHQSSFNSLQDFSGIWHGRHYAQIQEQDIVYDVSIIITDEGQRISISAELLDSPELGNSTFDAEIRMLDSDSGRLKFELLDRETFRLDKFEENSKVMLPAISWFMTLEAWQLEDKNEFLVDIRYNSETSVTMILRR